MYHSLTTFLAPVLRRPVFCAALFFIAGIVLGAHLRLPWHSWALAGIILLVAWWYLSARDLRIAAFTIALAFSCLGAARYAWQSPAPPPGDPRYLPDGGVSVIGYPLSPPRQTAEGWQATFRLTAHSFQSHWRRAGGDVYLLGAGTPPATGHYYRVLGRVMPVDEPGNPFGFSWRTYLQEHNLTYTISAYTLAEMPGGAPTSRLHAMRAFLAARLAATMPHRYGGLYAQVMNGLLLGVHGTELPPQFTEQFRRAGTIHLMVVSGSQVALLAMFLLFPLWFAPRGQVGSTYPRLRMVLLLLSLPVLGLYLLLADRGASVDRALLMVLLTMLSVFLGFSPLARRRSFRPDGLTLLAVAALVVLLINPFLLFSPGMQLSFAAVLGLMVVAPPISRLLYRILGHVALIPASTIGAQLAAAPILAWHFGAIPVLGLATNLIAIPIVALLVPLGLVTLLCALCLPGVAAALNHVNVWLLHVLLSVSAAAAGVPWAEWRWVVRSPWPICAYLLTLAIAVYFVSRWADSFGREWSIPAGREPRMW
ncbi:MAG: ComEC/Rec2 family competence protein [Armatimonadota bacterium]